MTPLVEDDRERGDLHAEIEQLGGELRIALTSVLESLAGPRPRPTRLTRAIGLDKSLASRFVRASQARSDLELMHLVPSPAGLRMLADSAGALVPRDRIDALLAATRRFEALLDAAPGGRAAIDAQISEGSHVVRGRSEQVARQAAFKSMSFLLGHFCELLSTTLFLVPAANGRTVDGIELTRRIGLRRMRPSTPLALLSLYVAPEDGRAGDSMAFDPIDGVPGVGDPTAFLLPEFCSKPIPALDVVREGSITTLVLAGDPSIHAPSQMASAFRIRNGWLLEQGPGMQSLRGYVLHVPCKQLVRDVFIAESLYPGVTPSLSFAMPGPRATTPPPRPSGPRHFTQVELGATIEPLPSGASAHSLSGVGDHAVAIQHVLDRAGHGATRFRGWRCSMTYPVPLIEMLWWLSHPGDVAGGA